MPFPVEAILFLFLIVMAVMIARLRDLFSAAMMTGVFGLLSAGLFTLMDAVDVAFTEASVGAGFSTVLILGTLSLTQTQEKKRPTKLLPFLVVAMTGAALLYGTADMPHYGDPEAAIHQHVAPEYIKGTEEIFHIPNMVTAILAGYRSYDTFGETTVIFTAGVGILLLIGGTRRRKGES
jgi:multicomponent Na+:H+ antiporter subunit B